MADPLLSDCRLTSFDPANPADLFAAAGLGGGSTHDVLAAIASDDADEMMALLAGRAGGVAGVLSAAVGPPLHVAATYGAGACARRLLAASAAVDARAKDGLTALHVAAADGNEDMLKCLLDAGADPAATTSDFWARLMSGGLRIDLPGGRTALHVAAAEGRLGAVRALLRADASLAAARDLDGATPLEVALEEGARSGQQALSQQRRQVAQVLAPGVELPDMAALREAAEAAARRRRERCDAAERARAAAAAGAAAAGAAAASPDFGRS